MLYSKKVFISIFALSTLNASCFRKSDEKKIAPLDSTSRLSDENAIRKEEEKRTLDELAQIQRRQQNEIDLLKSQIAELNSRLALEKDEDKIAKLQAQIAALIEEIKATDQKHRDQILALEAKLKTLRSSIENLEAKIIDKITSGSLAQTNLNNIQGSVGDHTQIYSLKGKYNTLVIPVEFASEPGFDGKFKDASRFTSGVAQEEIFGMGPNSMRSYYLHASGGLLNVSGEVAAPVKVGQPLSFYGKAVAGQNDKNAQALVVDALKQVQLVKGSDSSYWRQFDRWDLNDTDKDGIFSEPDGFLDAVVLIYAGKPQNVCQRIFDPAGKKPGSDDVAKDDPRREQAIECFNRIWPHRSSVFLPKDSPDFPKTGPILEGEERGALGYKINNQISAFDYNMQSEFSDISTFVHEFGHSLTLPDCYALEGENNVGYWDIMAQNGRTFGQEMSSFHKMALGWLLPKIVDEGQSTSAYLGSSAYVSPTKREFYESFSGPEFFSQIIKGFENKFNVLSLVPETLEPVFSAIMVKMKPTLLKAKEVDFPSSSERKAAYSGRFDNGQRSLKLNLEVPETGSAMMSFDTIFAIETETNFTSSEPEIKIVTDYDIGRVVVNGSIVEEFRLLSGDENNDSLAERNPNCEASRVLELRSKKIKGELSQEEKQEFNTKLNVCRTPIWLNKTYDLSAYRGKKVRVEVTYATDSGYNEFGIFIDNLKLGDKTLFDFEDDFIPGAEWAISTDGLREVQSRQFYMFEYRDPSETFSMSGSYNQDLNIQGSQGMGMFLEPKAGARARDRFRVVTLEHQPGVLGWYFDSTYDRRSNSPEAASQIGHGYYLPINNELREVSIPGIFADSSLKDQNGFYDIKKDSYKELASKQSDEFKCFAYPEFAKYVDGKSPDCSSFDDVNGIKDLTFNGLSLRFRRESANSFLPSEQKRQFVVSSPGAMIEGGTATRSAIQTFRHDLMGKFRPLKVYKANASGELILDEELTSQATDINPMNTFEDKFSTDDSPLLKDERFRANRATVNLRGFNFKVVAPDQAILDQYSSLEADGNSNVHRKPRAKILMGWSPVD